MCEQKCVIQHADAAFLDAAVLADPHQTQSELVLALVDHHLAEKPAQSCDGMCLTAHAKLLVQLWFLGRVPQLQMVH